MNLRHQSRAHTPTHRLDGVSCQGGEFFPLLVGRTSPRESFVCEEALASSADCLRTHAGFGAARTNSAPEARTSGPVSRFKRTLLGSLPVIF